MRRLLPVAVLLLLALAAPAHAIPDGGASPDTPGTSVAVSTRTLPVGGTIHFRVTGFPAGEVAYVKIDDGDFCTASATHGACVVYQQRLDSAGTAAGSFALPADIGIGRHWLRILASHEVDGGVKGYTARGNSDFTVVAAGPTTVASAATTGPAGAAATPSATGAGVPTAGATLSVDLPAAATPSASSTPTTTPAAQPIVQPVAETAAVTPTGHRFPYVGAAGLVILCVLAGFLVGRRRRG
jgi:hypothetical protein